MIYIFCRELEVIYKRLMRLLAMGLAKQGYVGLLPCCVDRELYLVSACPSPIARNISLPSCLSIFAVAQSYQCTEYV